MNSEHSDFNQPAPIPKSGLDVKYVVMNEHTLGYLSKAYPNDMGVLSGSVIKGGRDWKNGPAFIVPGHTHFRPATRADFAEYRVTVPSDFTETTEAESLCKSHELRVLQSHAGYFIGTIDDEHGPLSRDSHEYWPTREIAQDALDKGSWTKRENY